MVLRTASLSSRARIVTVRHSLGMTRFWVALAEFFCGLAADQYADDVKRQEWRKSSNHRQAAAYSVNTTCSVCNAGMWMSVNGSIQSLDGGSSCLSFALCSSWGVLVCRFLV